MINKRNILISIILLFLSFSYYGFNLPGIRKGQNVVDYEERLEESDISNQRDYDRTRKASLNKKPWLAENIHDMELIAWPDPNGRENVDTGNDDDDSRYYSSSCMLSGKRSISGEDACDPIKNYSVDLKYLKAGSIIKDINLKGPGTLVSSDISQFGANHVNFIIQPYANITSANITLSLTTISDENVQDTIMAAEIYARTGVFVSAADLIESRDSAKKYYSNSGCSLSTNINCEEECDCIGTVPTIYASASTIAPGGSITMYVDSGGLACPPYTWSVSSSKYSLDKSKTNNDLEMVTMTADSGSCGSGYSSSNISVTITVTDNCGITSTAQIMNTSGSWGAPTYVCDSPACSTVTREYNIVGSRRYLVDSCYSITSYVCNSGSPSCGSPNGYCGNYALDSLYSFANPSYTLKSQSGWWCAMCTNLTTGEEFRIDSTGYQDWECP